MSIQALSSFDSLSIWKEADAPISIALSERTIAIPASVFEEFQKIFFNWTLWRNIESIDCDFSWNKKDTKRKFTYQSVFQYPFSKETRNYFQSLMPLLDMDMQTITEVISKKSFSGQMFVDCERPGWSEEDYNNFYENIMRENTESEKNWESFVMKALTCRMYPTNFERLRAFVSEQTKKLLSIYEV